MKKQIPNHSKLDQSQLLTSPEHLRASKSSNKSSRRMFLRGVSGACMAIPFLPSVLSKSFAQESPVNVKPSFLAICTDHGGIWGQNFFPNDGLLNQSINYAQRDIRYGQLTHSPNAQNRIELSPMLNADASLLTSSVLSKLNVYRGLDIPYTIGHHRGAQTA